MPERRATSSRRPGAKKTAKKPLTTAAADPRFENGPLAVVDAEAGQVFAYCAGGLVLGVPPSPRPR